MIKETYELTITYYKYNSGQADNGTYSKIIQIEDKDKAFSLFSKIQKSIDKKLSEEEDSELVDRYIPYSGFFQKVSLNKLNIESIEMKLDGNSIENTYHNSSFYNCEYCYDSIEGYSNGCSSCNHTGKRLMNKESFELAQSAKDWTDEKVKNLWDTYNRIYDLKIGFYSWYIHGKEINIEAGYTSRGTSHSDNYELPLAWLFSENAEELITEQFNKDQAKKLIKEQQKDLISLELLKSQTQALEKKLKL